MTVSFFSTTFKYSTYLSLACAALLVGCEVGPDFKAPEPPKAKGFTDSVQPTTLAPSHKDDHASQRFVESKDVPANWWNVFGSPELNDLIKQALAQNPDMESGRKALVVAQEITAADQGYLWPSVTADPSVTRQKFSPAAYGIPGNSSIFTLYNASVDVSYGIDVFGLTRRVIEGAHAQEEYARFELEATYLTLTSNIVTAAVREASVREQIAEQEKVIAVDQQEVDILQKQLVLGGVAKPAVLQEEMTLMQDKQQLPALQKQLVQNRHLLNTLIGKTPDTEMKAQFTLASLRLPETLPLTVPSSLVEQRPDIKAAEANLHNASAAIGVATANMLPQITLSGSYGAEAVTFSGLGHGAANVWSLGAGLTQPLFEGGTLLHKRRESVALYDETAAQYRSTVLGAFRSVADTLRALEYDAKAHESTIDNEHIAADNLSIAREQMKDGAISEPQLLEVERTHHLARATLAQALALRLSDSVALYQALGGGWQQRTFSLSSTSMEQPK